ncbi:FAD-binding and (Fe-S)-binding domain-containing protein [Saccharopolyspora shandongensis]|uniref:FAD-binding and (Fe-S)-binding domain-containing protein n=1 Tax=Saccharopolyspora shandongensis TaxID=418495 RepID=UPI0033D688CC
MLTSGSQSHTIQQCEHDLLRELGPAATDIVDFSPGRRAQYSGDASNYRVVPAGVVTPRTVDDVVRAVRVCYRHGVPLVARGGGTSVAGNAITEGVVLDLSKHLNRILKINHERGWARVEPGVVLDDLRAAAAPHGLTFGPDPSTHSRCTLGGMIGNDACGSHSVAWGRTSDNVIELDVVLADGTQMTVGQHTSAEIDDIIASGGERGRVFAQLRTLVDRHRAEIRLELARFPRQVSGYPLHYLLPENRFDLAKALVGTEGTCAIVVSATVRLVRTPPQRCLAVMGFPSAVAAAEAVPDILRTRPLAVEGMDSALVDSAQQKSTQHLDAIEQLPPGKSWLYIEIGGETSAAAETAARALVAQLSEHSTNSAVVAKPSAQRQLWRIREDGAGLATRLPDGSEAWPGWEDAAVPPENLAAYLQEFEDLMHRHRRRGVIYGHFGDGCLHVRIDFPLTAEDGSQQFRQFMQQACELVIRHGGSFSGEHGDGRARAEFLPLMYSPAIMEAFSEFKAIFDPEDRLNPGVVVRPRPIDADLRVQPRRSLDITPMFSYEHDDGDMTAALRRCVGVGKCRTQHSAGVMCPSYQVTRDERDSTRGRARVLHEMLNGGVIEDGWKSTEVRDALDLCLSCKGCSHDCPTQVDMATYKSEFLHHHYRRRFRPPSHYSMGWLPLWARLARTAPRLVNAVTSSPAAGVLKRFGGIAPERSIPRFALESFSTWFRTRPATPGAGSRGTVLLWVDSFGNALNPGPLRAATEVLEEIGFRVLVPPGTQCCGLTWITTGQLDVARRVQRRTLKAITPQLDEVSAVVGIEPSCTATLRTDLPDLLAGHPTAKRLAHLTKTFAETIRELAPGWQPPRLPIKTLRQTHCHQHAVMGDQADSWLLTRMGVDDTKLNSGCCGLAGNFGFEKDHYEVSVAAGERVLLPAVRAAEDTVRVLADGFSCHTQIKQGAHRHTHHLAELVREAHQTPTTPSER